MQQKLQHQLAELHAAKVVRERVEDEHAAAQQQWQQDAIAKQNELVVLREQLAALPAGEGAAQAGSEGPHPAGASDEEEISHLRMNAAMLKVLPSCLDLKPTGAQRTPMGGSSRVYTAVEPGIARRAPDNTSSCQHS